MKRFPLDLILAGVATVAAVIACADDLTFEGIAWLRQARMPTGAEQPHPPEIKIHCGEPGCTWGMIFYDVIVDGKGEVQAVRFRDQIGKLSRETRAMADQAARVTSWDNLAPGRTIRSWQQVEVLPPIRTPTRHVPFPSTDGKPISIFLERTGCFGTCPAYVTILRNDGTVYFCGRSDVRALGWQTGRIAPEEFNRLVEQFRIADFFSLEDQYSAEVTDNPTYLVGINVGGQAKAVLDYVGEEAGMPPTVTRLQNAIDKAAGTERWIQPQPTRMDFSTPTTDCSTPPSPFNDSALPS
ncbi:MAG: hypothetical protein EON96_09280 [Caulobacteraceae bacterium]|nr:MAG: hypothetical protein EON96_09280 [Caulobacteraceae bacterium]